MPRYTSDDRMNSLIDRYVKMGWKFTRGSKHPRLEPPKEVLEANPDKPPFVTIAGTPSDYRTVANTRAALRSYVDPRPEPSLKRTLVATHAMSASEEFEAITAHFCPTCGPTGPEFPNREERDQHMETHKRKPMSTSGVKYKKHPCPICRKELGPQGVRGHIKAFHADTELGRIAESLNIKAIWSWTEPTGQAKAIEAVEAVPQLASLPDDLDAKEFTDTLMGLLFPRGVVVHDSATMRKLSTWVDLSYEIYTQMHKE